MKNKTKSDIKTLEKMLKDSKVKVAGLDIKILQMIRSKVDGFIQILKQFVDSKEFTPEVFDRLRTLWINIYILYIVNMFTAYKILSVKKFWKDIAYISQLATGEVLIFNFTDSSNPLLEKIPLKVVPIVLELFGSFLGTLIFHFKNDKAKAIEYLTNYEKKLDSVVDSRIKFINDIKIARHHLTIENKKVNKSTITKFMNQKLSTFNDKLKSNRFNILYDKKTRLFKDLYSGELF